MKIPAETQERSIPTSFSGGEHQATHLSNEKNLGWLGYIGDDILPSYIGLKPSTSIYLSNEENSGYLGVYRGIYYPVIWGLFHKPLSGSLLTNQYNGK